MIIGPAPDVGALLTHRLVEVPIRDDDEPFANRFRLVAALAGAHALNRTVASAWVRSRRRGAIQVLVGGVATTLHGGEASVDFPLGARGRQLDPGAVEALFSELHWIPCQITLDATSADEDPLGDRLEDLFLFSSDPIGFLVVAEPLSEEDAETAFNKVSDEVGALEALRGGRGTHRRQLARAEQNLEYYARNLGCGGWRLRLWAGAHDATTARYVAAMIAGTADAAQSPVLLRPSSPIGNEQQAWSDASVVGADAVSALARPPFRELPGLRVTRLPEFDQNIEDRTEVRLGSVLDGSRMPAAPFGISLDSVNRHVFVTGATGSGKSETVRNLLHQLNGRGIPWMVVEPAKAEYAAMVPWLDPANPPVVIRPGDPSQPPPQLNPLEPSSLLIDGTRHTFPLQTHLDMIGALFTASFDTQEPFPQVLSAGLTRAYLSRGWNLVTGQPNNPSLSPPEWPVLGDLVRESLEVVDGLGYGREVRDNMRGFIRVRVESLRSGTPGRFFEGGFPLDLEHLLECPSIFEIEDLGDDKDKAFFIGNLVIRLVELLRLRKKHGIDQGGLRHVLVIEEAHRLLRRVAEDSPAAHAVTMFANLLAEIRAYGEGVVVAEQIPSKVIPDLVKNSAVKIMHRLPSQDDREFVGATMNLNEKQSAFVVALQPGMAVAHAAGMDRPVLAQVDRVEARPRTGASRGSALLASRSPSCPNACTGAKCTLGELESSRDLVTPAISLWIELAVVAHLTHDEIGTPRGPWLDRLRNADDRRARCAIGLAVDTSVGRRGALLREWFEPAAFQRDVAERMTDQLVSGRGIGRPPIRWTVGHYRFSTIGRDLATPDSAGSTDRPHPRTPEWLRRGIDLPGPTRADQRRQLDAALTGIPIVNAHQLAGSPPVLDDLCSALGHREDSGRQRIERAVADLGLESRWLAIRVGAIRD